MKYNSLKRFTALLMACLMVFGMMPTGALAADGTSPSVNMEDQPIVQPRVAGLNDLSSILKEASFSQLGDNNTMVEGQKYPLSLLFKEGGGSEQLSTDNMTYTYRLPAGLGYSLQKTNIQINIAGKAIPATVSIADDTLTVTVQDDTENKTLIQHAPDVEIAVDVYAEYKSTSDSQKIQFNDKVNVTLTKVQPSLGGEKTVGNIYLDDAKENYIIPYTIQITAKGDQTNVVVEDVITQIAGSQYPKIDQNSIKVKKQYNDISDDQYKIESVDPNKGFTATVYSLNNNEVLQITYNAIIPRNGQTEGLTFDAQNEGQTKNTATFKSDKVTTKGKAEITLSGKTLNALQRIQKSADVAQNTVYNGADLGEGFDGSAKYKKIKWAITVNQDKDLALNGVTMVDTMPSVLIPDKAAKVTHKIEGVSQASIEFDDFVPSYTFQDNVGDKKTHVFEYYTYVRVDNLTQDWTHFYNKAEIPNPQKPNEPWSATGDAAIQRPAPPSGVSKDGVLSDDGKYITWTISLCAPVNTQKITLTETVPKTNSIYTPILETSIATLTADDLALNTGNSLQFVEKENEKGIYDLTFNIAPQATVRYLTVTVRTEIPNEYKKQYPNGIFTYYNRVNVSFQDGPENWNVKTGYAEKTLTDKLTYMDKQANANLVNGNNYTDGLPRFGYVITLNNITKDQFPIVISENFDEKLGRLELETDTAKCHNNQNGIGYNWPAACATVDVDKNNKTITIKDPTTDDDYTGPYYLQYTLKVRDQSAYDSLKEEAMQSPDLKVSINNTASWTEGGKTSAATSVVYSYKPVKKTNLGDANEDSIFDFEIEVNPDGKILSQNGTLHIIDTMTSLSLVGGISIEPEGTAFSYTVAGNRVDIYVPDGKAVKLKYSAQVLANGGAGKVSFSNVASLEGYQASDTAKGEYTFSGGGSGKGSVSSVRIRKVDSTNLNKGLGKVKFKLQHKDNTSDWTDVGVESTTDEYGYAIFKTTFLLFDPWTGAKDDEYRLVEETPSGYIEGKPFVLRFYEDPSKVADNPQHYFVAGSDIDIIITNTPVSFSIQKVDENGAPFSDGAGATLTLTKSDDSAITKTWVTGKVPVVFPLYDYPEGTYTLHEGTAPTNYDAIPDFTFTVDSKGNITNVSNASAANGSGSVLTVTNLPHGAPKRVTLYKKNINGIAIDGAGFTLTEIGTSNISTFTSKNGGELLITGLECGKSYTLEETTVPDGYKKANNVTISVTEEGVVKVTGASNNVIVDDISDDTVSINGYKVWLNVDGKPVPDQITIRVTCDPAITYNNKLGTTHDITVDVDDKDNYKWKILDLPKYAYDTDGKAVEVWYKPATEVKMVAYDPYVTDDPQGRGRKVENTYNADQKSISGTKNWSGKVPNPNQITLTVTDEKGNPITGFVNKLVSVVDGTWEITGLPKYNTLNEEIFYNVVETTVDGYLPGSVKNVVENGEANRDKFEITNTPTRMTLTKQSADGKNLAGAVFTLNPANVKNESPTYTTDANGTLTIEYLKVDQEYTLTETKAPKGYTVAKPITIKIDSDGKLWKKEDNGSWTECGKNNLVVTDDRSTDTVTVSGTKTWKAADDSLLNSHPETISIVIEGTANGKHVSTTPANVKPEADGVWYYRKLPMYTYNETTGEASEITYTVTENVPAGYFLTTKEGNAFTNQKISVKISKEGDDKKPLSGATLVIREKNKTDDLQTIITDGSASYDVSFNLVIGTTYTLVETAAPAGYTIAPSIDFTVNADGKVVVGDKEQSNNTIVMIDTLKPTAQVTFTKKNKNNVVLKDAVFTLTKENSDEVIGTYSSDEKGEFTVTNLAYDTTYTLAETGAPDGYQIASPVTIAVGVNGDITITGTSVSEENGKTYITDEISNDKVSFTGEKIWVNNGQSHPEEITIVIDSNYEVTYGDKTDKHFEIPVEPVASASNSFTWSTPEFPMYVYDSNGSVVKVIYNVTEKAMPAYPNPEVKYDETTGKYTITNTYEPGKKTISGEKTWTDGATTIHQITLTVTDEDGNPIPGIEPKVVDVVDGKWEITGLPKYDTLNNEIYYKVVETTVDGYQKGTVQRDDQNKDSFTVENKPTSMKLTKQSADGKNLENAEFTLSPANVNGKSVFTTSADGTLTIEYLKVDEEYTLTETKAPKGYTAAALITIKIDSETGKLYQKEGETWTECTDNNLVVTDERDTTTVTVVGTKTWEAADGTPLTSHPDKISITITGSDNSTVTVEVQPDENGEWEYSGLTKYIYDETNGAASEITYTVTENVPAGYFLTTGEGNAFTNQKISVKISKEDMRSAALPGAKLVIMDKDGNMVEAEFISSDTPHEVQAALEVGKTYILHENSAPQGYARADETPLS